MTTKSDILRLIEQRGALTDSELAGLLGMSHQQINQAARRLAAAGTIRRVSGPDGVIRNHLDPVGMPPPRAQGTSGRDELSPSPRAWPVLGRLVAGTPVARDHLTGLGFMEHALTLVTDANVPEGGLRLGHARACP